ncbi:hypothetical protein M407DRAFT_24263 [Tulasnella calospora MUT 4182]|uniref:Uncharacterized protein n=1 Tax=Tulasnella calospora MUT 4182 TaxID=1051891 RepID=A0A0C3QJM4_9AGAM|nr:hypothetical protein M407DRAFT_24263 [Tulasnella calospora MUT 4182]
MSMIITDTLQQDLKDYLASKAVDKIIMTPRFDTNDDQPMFIKLLKESLIRYLDT